MQRMHVIVSAKDRPQTILDAQRVRKAVFVDELGLLDPGPARLDREEDPGDQLPTTVHLVAYCTEETGAAVPVGAVRLLLPGPRAGGCVDGSLDLDLADRYDLADFARPDIRLAEVSRMCVLQAYRASGALAGLYNALLEESRRRGLTHWIAMANAETDCAEDACIAYKVLEHRGLVSSSFCVRPSRVHAPPERPSRCFYSAEERARARRQDLDLRIPRTLSSFAKLSARYIGEPAYEEHYRVFAIPLTVDLAQAPMQVVPPRGGCSRRGGRAPSGS